MEVEGGGGGGGVEGGAAPGDKTLWDRGVPRWVDEMGGTDG